MERIERGQKENEGQTDRRLGERRGLLEREGLGASDVQTRGVQWKRTETQGKRGRSLRKGEELIRERREMEAGRFTCICLLVV
jgi:hypothetical protein